MTNSFLGQRICASAILFLLYCVPAAVYSLDLRLERKGNLNSVFIEGEVAYNAPLSKKPFKSKQISITYMPRSDEHIIDISSGSLSVHVAVGATGDMAIGDSAVNDLHVQAHGQVSVTGKLSVAQNLSMRARTIRFEKQSKLHALGACSFDGPNLFNYGTLHIAGAAITGAIYNAGSILSSKSLQLSSKSGSCINSGPGSRIECLGSLAFSFPSGHIQNKAGVIIADGAISFDAKQISNERLPISTKNRIEYAGSGPGLIASRGSDIIIKGALSNTAGLILAHGNISCTRGSFSNVSQALYKTYTQDETDYTTCTGVSLPLCLSGGLFNIKAASLVNEGNLIAQKGMNLSGIKKCVNGLRDEPNAPLHTYYDFDLVYAKDDLSHVLTAHNQSSYVFNHRNEELMPDAKDAPCGAFWSVKANSVLPKYILSPVAAREQLIQKLHKVANVLTIDDHYDPFTLYDYLVEEGFWHAVINGTLVDVKGGKKRAFTYTESDIASQIKRHAPGKTIKPAFISKKLDLIASGTKVPVLSSANINSYKGSFIYYKIVSYQKQSVLMPHVYLGVDTVAALNQWCVMQGADVSLQASCIRNYGQVISLNKVNIIADTLKNKNNVIKRRNVPSSFNDRTNQRYDLTRFSKGGVIVGNKVNIDLKGHSSDPVTFTQDGGTILAQEGLDVQVRHGDIEMSTRKGKDFQKMRVDSDSFHYGVDNFTIRTVFSPASFISSGDIIFKSDSGAIRGSGVKMVSSHGKVTIITPSALEIKSLVTAFDANVRADGASWSGAMTHDQQMDVAFAQVHAGGDLYLKAKSFTGKASVFTCEGQPIFEIEEKNSTASLSAKLVSRRFEWGCGGFCRVKHSSNEQTVPVQPRIHAGQVAVMNAREHDFEGADLNGSFTFKSVDDITFRGAKAKSDIQSVEWIAGISFFGYVPLVEAFKGNWGNAFYALALSDPLVNAALQAYYAPHAGEKVGPGMLTAIEAWRLFNTYSAAIKSGVSNPVFLGQRLKILDGVGQISPSVALSLTRRGESITREGEVKTTLKGGKATFVTQGNLNMQAVEVELGEGIVIAKNWLMSPAEHTEEVDQNQAAAILNVGADGGLAGGGEGGLAQAKNTAYESSSVKIGKLSGKVEQKVDVIGTDLEVDISDFEAGEVTIEALQDTSSSWNVDVALSAGPGMVSGAIGGGQKTAVHTSKLSRVHIGSGELKTRRTVMRGGAITGNGTWVTEELEQHELYDYDDEQALRIGMDWTSVADMAGIWGLINGGAVNAKENRRTVGNVVADTVNLVTDADLTNVNRDENKVFTALPDEGFRFTVVVPLVDTQQLRSNFNELFGSRLDTSFEQMVDEYQEVVLGEGFDRATAQIENDEIVSDDFQDDEVVEPLMPTFVMESLNEQTGIQEISLSSPVSMEGETGFEYITDTVKIDTKGKTEEEIAAQIGEAMEAFKLKDPTRLNEALYCTLKNGQLAKLQTNNKQLAKELKKSDSSTYGFVKGVFIGLGGAAVSPVIMAWWLGDILGKATKALVDDPEQAIDDFLQFSRDSWVLADKVICAMHYNNPDAMDDMMMAGVAADEFKRLSGDSYAKAKDLLDPIAYKLTHLTPQEKGELVGSLVFQAVLLGVTFGATSIAKSAKSAGALTAVEEISQISQEMQQAQKLVVPAEEVAYLGDVAELTVAGDVDKVVKIATRLNHLQLKLKNGFFDNHSLEKLLKAANKPDRNGLSRIGRAYQKHQSRPGSVYDKVHVNPRILNERGLELAQVILSRQHLNIKLNRFGGIDIQDQILRKGLRYDGFGEFMTLLEP